MTEREEGGPVQVAIVVADVLDDTMRRPGTPQFGSQKTYRRAASEGLTGALAGSREEQPDCPGEKGSVVIPTSKLPRRIERLEGWGFHRGRAAVRDVARRATSPLSSATVGALHGPMGRRLRRMS